MTKAMALEGLRLLKLLKLKTAQKHRKAKESTEQHSTAQKASLMRALIVSSNSALTTTLTSIYAHCTHTCINLMTSCEQKLEFRYLNISIHNVQSYGI